MGTEIADLTVCGALPPYNALIGGKLVGMLAVSPTVVREYHRRYSGYASQIASSLAGKPVNRRSNLVYVGTTSLYGSNSSQYNRLRLPGDVLHAREDIVFRRLGRSGRSAPPTFPPIPSGLSCNWRRRAGLEPESTASLGRE